MQGLAGIFFVLLAVVLVASYLSIRREWLRPGVTAGAAVLASIVLMVLISLGQGNSAIQAIVVGIVVGGLFSGVTVGIAWYFHSQELRQAGAHDYGEGSLRRGPAPGREISMAILPLLQVDAFTTQALQGNPCAVVFDADNLDEATMLAVAREMNFSETAFVMRSTIADFRARYFTPAGEIPLAGHPTIATIFALVDTGRLKLNQPLTTISLELQVGPIKVEIKRGDQGQAERIIMAQKPPQFFKTYDPLDIMLVFGLEAADALPDCLLQTVSTGTPQLMIPVRDLDVLRRAKWTFRPTSRCVSRRFLQHASVRALRSKRPGQTFARHFVAPPDIAEDPFTGSATGGMGAYLWHYGLIDSPQFVAEQGHWMGRPGQASVEVIGPPQAMETVKVGGAAVTVVRGELIL